ncbi:hypothetical protein [Halanaerobacter jeridensis]|uniref:Nucleic acid-binding Zn-ribbon protein n=1 Tax=Halanaerobacter jeridensis TaxID=706427 RepID=A0A938XWL4_9FIRM|nr:hypothetical protein [Halanaerobacter jeridensis]MBM7556982.1 putative nucleic acid-binding Zn-ribbon protein [Halanaerobacter jeridensis]
MLLFKSDFIKDVVILLLVTIILGTLLSLVIGTISDYYFGDAVDSLIGDYENNDLLLIIDEREKEETVEKIKEVLQTKLPGAKLSTGINLAGKSNLFISVGKKYKRRAVFLNLEDYFNDIKGITTTSLMTEPRLTINGLKNKASQLLEDKIADLDHVAFTFPDGDSLEVIIDEAQFTAQVKEKINTLLNDYQMLGIRFPIKEEVDNLVQLGSKLEKVLKDDYGLAVKNITELNSSELGSLAKTMTEMKSFLSSYASTIKIKVFTGQKIEVGDKLIIPAEDKKKIDLRVSNVNDMIATAVITTGDSSAAVGDLVYNSDSTTAVGKVEINNPRQKLDYLVSELKKLVPQLGSIFNDADSILANLEELFATLQLLKGTTTEIETLNQKLAGYTANIEQLDGREIKANLDSLEHRLEQLVVIITRLEFMRDLILDLRVELTQLESRINAAQAELRVGSNYYNNLQQLAENIAQLKIKVVDNTQEIIDQINRYNPLLKEIKSWQKNVQDFNAVIDKLIKESPQEFAKRLTAVSNKDLITRLQQVRQPASEEKLAAVKEQLVKLRAIDFAGITAQLEYIEQSLPKLKDEEITASIDLLDHYLAGRAIPGAEISLLLPAQNVDLKVIKEEIKTMIPQQISFYDSPVGIIVPNLRNQIYQILSEVKIVLTVVTALLCTSLSLLFDHGLIITSLQELNTEKIFYSNPAFYYSLTMAVITLSSICYLTGIESPYLPWWSSILVGVGLGLIIFKEAAVINDFAKAEFKAGEAFGFNYAQIMRQIIIPAAKPGLLKILNQRQTYF